MAIVVAVHEGFDVDGFIRTINKERFHAMVKDRMRVEKMELDDYKFIPVYTVEGKTPSKEIDPAFHKKFIQDLLERITLSGIHMEDALDILFVPMDEDIFKTLNYNKVKFTAVYPDFKCRVENKLSVTDTPPTPGRYGKLMVLNDLNAFPYAINSIYKDHVNHVMLPSKNFIHSFK